MIIMWMNKIIPDGEYKHIALRGISVLYTANVPGRFKQAGKEMKKKNEQKLYS